MTARRDETRFRPAGAEDAAAVAKLHAASWRAHYRGSLTDAYLEGPIDGERLRVWSERLEGADPALTVILAEEDRALVGFVCALAARHAAFGSLVDNLHVAVGRKGSGIGRALMRKVATRLADAAPERPVHLYALDANLGAHAFYARIGGAPAGNEIHDGPDGSRSPVTRILWASPAALRDASAAR